MSRESLEWLNENTLIGFVSKRGKAWHYSERSQGETSNHYTDAIPVEDVRSRLFNWEPISLPLSVTIPGVMNEDGVSPDRTVTDPNRQVIVRPDNGSIMGVFKSGYQIHGFNDWLINNISTLIDDSNLQISSAGLLKGGAQAWVQIEMPENVDTPEGITFRPYLCGSTSLDGSLATGYTRGSTFVVCDNTLAIARSSGTTIKVKHTKNSLSKITDVRAALDIVHNDADDISAEIARLCAVEVTDPVWKEFLSLETAPASDSKRAVTMSDAYRDNLSALWNNDPRVSPWKGTAMGVLQAVNTYAHHGGIVRGASRSERNAERMVSGKINDLDSSTLATLDRALAAV